jgi:hypothetical protein
MATNPTHRLVLDYATPSRAPVRGFAVGVTVRLMLLAGVAAVFLPFTASVSPWYTCDMSVEVVRRWVSGRSLHWDDLGLPALGLALEMAIPLLALTIAPVSWPRLTKTIAILSMICGVVAAVGAVYVAVLFFTNPPSSNNDWLAWGLYGAAVVAGGALTVRAWRRANDLRQIVWMLLATSYIPVATICLWSFRGDSQHEYGYWLTTVNLIPVLVQTINTVMARRPVPGDAVTFGGDSRPCG